MLSWSTLKVSQPQRPMVQGYQSTTPYMSGAGICALVMLTVMQLQTGLCLSRLIWKTVLLSALCRKPHACSVLLRRGDLGPHLRGDPQRRCIIAML